MIRILKEKHIPIYRAIPGEKAMNLSPSLPPLDRKYREGYTGFWTTDIQDIYEIVNAQREAQEEGDLWADELLVLETTLDNVISDDPREYKVNHDPRFDKNEIFVKDIIDVNKIDIQNWEDKLYKVLPDGREVRRYD